MSDQEIEQFGQASLDELMMQTWHIAKGVDRPFSQEQWEQFEQCERARRFYASDKS